MSIFTADLLAVLPPSVRGKISRLEADPGAHAYLVRAARWLRYHGATTRHTQHGVLPAHVVTALEPVNNHVTAVDEARQRLAELDAYEARLNESVAAGELQEVWRDVLQTDADLARLAWQRVEEALIVSAESAGIVITRRSDVDPAALLEIERA